MSGEPTLVATENSLRLVKTRTHFVVKEIPTDTVCETRFPRVPYQPTSRIRPGINDKGKVIHSVAQAVR